MKELRQDSRERAVPTAVNPGYASLQMAKALATSEHHEDPETRGRAKARVSKWQAVLEGILSGTIRHGSRTPVEGAPAWATLEVVLGGFATGKVLAGGPLQQHERVLAGSLAIPSNGNVRRSLNAHFLSDSGLASLLERLQNGYYHVSVPEEGALLVVAWLVGNGHRHEALELIDEMVPYFSQLRFYPVPLAQAPGFDSTMQVRTVGTVVEDLGAIRPNKRILAQREAVEVWSPFHDRVVALFLETFEGDWPCRRYPEGWPERAMALLAKYAELRRKHTLCGKMERANGHRSQLREFLGRCARRPRELTGREVGRIRLILRRYAEKHSAPDSAARAEALSRQAADVSAPTFRTIARVAAQRLENHPDDDGLDSLDDLVGAVTGMEAARSGVPEGTPIPASIRRKIERCRKGTMDALIERGLVASGEALARILPQISSQVQAASIADPALRHLYVALYRPFRRRRSLLLFNFERQVQFEDLPWVAAVERFRCDDPASRELARQTLGKAVAATITAFPWSIIPNKLITELRALARGAALDIPLVNELAADIFMGSFSRAFLESARASADLLDGSLYANYYGIEFDEVRRISAKPSGGRENGAEPDDFAQLCAARRCHPRLGGGRARSGSILEQQQILTTKNLAALFAALNLTESLRGQLGGMARRCFEWICKRPPTREREWRPRPRRLKQAAYAWRQMVFFLALLPDSDQARFPRWAKWHLSEHGDDFRDRICPALRGLEIAAQGGTVEGECGAEGDARVFLGWTTGGHWLVPDD